MFNYCLYNINKCVVADFGISNMGMSFLYGYNNKTWASQQIKEVDCSVIYMWRVLEKEVDVLSWYTPYVQRLIE